MAMGLGSGTATPGAAGPGAGADGAGGAQNQGGESGVQ